MNKVIVTTTINSPTEATLKFCEIAKNKGWHFVIVGDTKTPHEEYWSLEKQYPNIVTYLAIPLQEYLYPRLSNAIGWKTIQRRNLGFAYAYNECEADIMATVDDDNIPYDNWGDDIRLVEPTVIQEYINRSTKIFDPLSRFKGVNGAHPHRGYPLEELTSRYNTTLLERSRCIPLVQANLWDGDPDIGAMDRLLHKPMLEFPKPMSRYFTNQITVFNSQNTFIAREAIPYYFMFPYVGRYDDIIGSYVLQKYIGLGHIAFAEATVFQARNEQDLITNLENEIWGYRNILKIIHAAKDSWQSLIPINSQIAWNEYRKCFK